MANELPYFRFTVQAWQNGKISIEDYSLKGLFIDVCGFYWVQDCSIDIAMLEKKFRDSKDKINELFELDILKKDGQMVSILFLDEQFDLLSTKRKSRQDAGRQGGIAKSKALSQQKTSNATTMLEQNSSYKDKDKDKIKEDKNLAFAKKLDAYLLKNKEALSNIFKEVPTIKKSANLWLEYKFKKKGYKETKWANVMVERIKSTSIAFIEKRIIETIAGETYEDYFYSNHQVEFDKSAGKPLGASSQAKKPKEKTLEELRNS